MHSHSNPSSRSPSPSPGHPCQVFTLLNQHLVPEVLSLELKTSLQIPSFQIIGLPGPEVSEAKDRVKSALESAGFEFPRRKVVLNLSPSSVRKQGTGMDLAMAIAIAADATEIDARIFAWGELGLDGRVKGGHHRLRALAAAWISDAEIALLPIEDVAELRRVPELVAALIARRPNRPPLFIRGIAHLHEVLDLLTHREKRGVWMDCESMASFAIADPAIETRVPPPGVRLPRALQRWIAIASAGRHHLFLAGPRGVGKSLAVDWLSALNPPASAHTELERNLIGELKGLPSTALSVRRIGSQVRPAALIGSLQTGALRPGEFTLAHGGLLIADEFPEWTRDSRETFREPLERGRVTLSRVGQTIEMPAEFQLAANGNLCPCGGEFSEHTAHLSLRCRCLAPDRTRYLQRVSGPVLDRIDILFRVSSARVSPAGTSPGFSSDELRTRVDATRARLQSQFGKSPGELTGADLESILAEAPDLATRLDAGSYSSFRERHRILRTALTMAEWDGGGLPETIHFQELRFMREEFFRQSS